MKPTTDARGHYTIGKELVDTVVDRVRRLVGRSPRFHMVVIWSLKANTDQTTAAHSRDS